MKKLVFALLWFACCTLWASQRTNFNADWLMHVGDVAEGSATNFADHQWQTVTLPHAFNEREAYSVSIEQLSDTIIWYRKHFQFAATAGQRYTLEFEGVRFAADVWVNGHHAGSSENGVMAFGIDITPYIISGNNVVAVRVDNSWTYRERATGQRYQWNDRNFNANYGGICKNVWLHASGNVYFTLPLYSNLGTTGTYVYGTQYDVPRHEVRVNVDAQVRNATDADRRLCLHTRVIDPQGNQVLSFSGTPFTLKAGATRTAHADALLRNAEFWSWGYGYLYRVESQLTDASGQVLDSNRVVTGFRQTRFAEGKVWLNNRVMMVHGYAQRTSNEWPGVGIDVPAWLSDYSNRLMVQGNANMVRWMHVTPSKQDVESCDRVGLPEAMPAGDAEKDVTGRRWQQRVELMRDAMIYNRNNPSILFYEGGNKGISHEHMLELLHLRDSIDPYGGRAMGAREMLADSSAEYGGEMLYINKSASKPLWAMEYCRDEGLRRYHDAWSWPYHPEGEGPLYRGKPAAEYNHNQDQMALEMVRRWYDYYRERPGTGTRVNSGGVKIVFADTNTHHRGELNYRTSGVVDAMRLPKDSYYANQLMWDGWVTPERQHTYIVGHWNYPEGTVKPVYVLSTADSVALYVNGEPVGTAQRSYHFLYTFPSVAYHAGEIKAVSYEHGKAVSQYSISTVGRPAAVKLKAITNPLGFKADGADMALIEAEVVDSQGRVCPLDHRMLHFQLKGNGEWLGGIADTPDSAANSAKATAPASREGLLDTAERPNLSHNYVGSMQLPVECGVNRVLLRSTRQSGDVLVTCTADSLPPATLKLHTQTVDVASYQPDLLLPCNLSRGATPQGSSYTDVLRTVAVKRVTAGSNAANVSLATDDNETTEWKSDGKQQNAWIEFELKQRSPVDEIALKLTGWRTRQYPLVVLCDGKEAWRGTTEPSLGYVHLSLRPTGKVRKVRVQLTGAATDYTPQSDVTELAGGHAAAFDQVQAPKGKCELRIVEVDLLKR